MSTYCVNPAMIRRVKNADFAATSSSPLLGTSKSHYDVAAVKLLKQRLGYLAQGLCWRYVVTGSILLKRLIDIVLSSILLVVLFPLFVLTALVIKLADGGPAVFWQTRVGQHGKLFRFPKFRSMVINAEALKAALASHNQHKTGVTFKMRRDPRVTRVGSFLRKSSIDELPQLWCVLKGEMSMVGPRPAVPGEVAAYTLLDRRRLDVKPGLTCLWQVSGRGDVSFDRQVELDLEYIENHSLALDLLILVKTIPAVLSGKGSY